MPAIIAKSISILSDAGLGMAMFSLGTAFILANIHTSPNMMVVGTDLLPRKLQVCSWHCSLR